MYLRFVIILLLSGLGMVQVPPNPAPSNSAKQGSGASSQNSASELPADAPVITVDGFCDATPLATIVKSASAGCESVVTRKQFEQLVNALDPNMRPEFRHDLGRVLPRMLLLSKKAQEIGLDKDPRYPQMMKWSSLQMLANRLNLQMQEQAGNVTDADVEKYYKDNAPKFEQAELQRIIIPRNQQQPGSADPAGGENSASDAAVKTEAEKLWTKAVAGGDFTALQREAYEAAGLSSPPPNVNLGQRKRAGLPQDQQRVFHLQPGQVSEVLSDATGFYIYKVVSKQMIPLAKVQKEIHDTLQLERMQAAQDSLFGSAKTQLNLAYFGETIPAAEGNLFEKSDSSPKSTEGQPGAATPAGQTQSSDKEWADSSVHSYLLEKNADDFVAPPERVVPKSAPVITINGLCDNQPASATGCQTFVSRGDFEAMQNAVDPKLAANDLRRMADQYADLLLRGEKGRQLGLEKTDQYEFAMAFMAADNCFKMYNNLILERSRELTDADLAEFYRENPRLFEEIKTLRLVIPQYKAFPPGKPQPTPEQNAAAHAEMKKEAESIAQRAALPGADFQALENEAWRFSGYVEDPPEVAQPSLLRWETWPQTRLPIFDLKVGEVSKLIDEPHNGFYVYKIIAKREVPLEDARAYIRKRYAAVRYEGAVTSLTATIKTSMDDQYFSPEKPKLSPASPGFQPGTNNTRVPGVDIKVPKKVNLD